MGHVARIQEDHIPKRLLFGWLTHPRPMRGCKLRWRDRVRKYLKRFKIDEGRWYRDAKERGVWRAQCREGLDTCTKERLEDRIRKEAASTIDRHDTSSNTTTTPFVCDRHDTSSNTTTTPFVCDMPKIVQEKAGHCKA